MDETDVHHPDTVTHLRKVMARMLDDEVRRSKRLESELEATKRTLDETICERYPWAKGRK